MTSVTLWERRLSYSWRAGNLLARSSLEAVHSPTETMAKETNLTFESSGGELDYGRTTWRDGRVALKAGLHARVTEKQCPRKRLLEPTPHSEQTYTHIFKHTRSTSFISSIP